VLAAEPPEVSRPGPKLGVESLSLRFVHQGHGAFGEAEVVDLVVVDLDQHINNGVANADNIEGFELRHGD